MNLLSKLSSSAKAKTIEPREIFMTLPSKAPGYGYPRDVQSEVWKKWFDRSVNWFKENYVYPNECVPIMIHPSKVVDEVASPDENMRVMTEKELTCFRKNLRDFYSTLCQNGNLSDVNKINELLRIESNMGV